MSLCFGMVFFPCNLWAPQSLNKLIWVNWMEMLPQRGVGCWRQKCTHKCLQHHPVKTHPPWLCDQWIQLRTTLGPLPFKPGLQLCTCNSCLSAALRITQDLASAHADSPTLTSTPPQKPAWSHSKRKRWRNVNVRHPLAWHPQTVVTLGGRDVMDKWNELL